MLPEGVCVCVGGTNQVPIYCEIFIKYNSQFKNMHVITCYSHS